MKQLLEYIIPNIVNHPEEVEISETDSNGLLNYTIKVNPEDMGRVIGKSGKVIKAIRQIARIMAIKKGIRINIDVLDEQAQPASQSSDEPVTPESEEVQTPAE
ncbi:KH domain-containing protein [Candidatus Collierbacteria bacterium]|nr:KH domain-containing protein [Candidatus Collierbacteria bacterium]